MKDLPGYQVFYVPREFDLIKDGVRYQDDDFAVMIDKKMKNFLDIMNVPYTVIQGNLKARVDKVKEIIGFENRKATG